MSNMIRVAAANAWFTEGYKVVIRTHYSMYKIYGQLIWVSQFVQLEELKHS